MTYTFSTFVANLPRLPPRENRTVGTNPFTLISKLSPLGWAMFFSGWLAWLTDAYDFFSVSLTITRLSVQFGKPTHDITTAITLTLLFRSLGAILFGVISDRYGRKWPLIVNLIIIACLELGAGFVNTYSQFLAVRSLFGIGMGGIWGMSASTALESMPAECRGLFSGILQQGYAVGYLIAAVVNLTLVQQKNDWRPLFFVGAGLSVFAALVRLLLPESEFFRRAKEEGKIESSDKTKTFFKEAWIAIKLHWIRFIYAVLLMTGFNFFSHGSQDLYPTYIQITKGFAPPSNAPSVLTIIGNCGAVAGGTIAGAASQFLGRRITIIICCIWTGCFIPLWILPSSFSGLAAGAFFVQAGVQGAWGVIPVLLQELSPPAFRAVFPGLAYQLGNMVSSASSQIEATAGDNLKTTVNGSSVADYATVQAILIGVVAGYIILLCLVGPEYHGSHFENAKTAYEAGGGQVHNEDLIEEAPRRRRDQEDIGSGDADVKVKEDMVEEADEKRI